MILFSVWSPDEETFWNSWIEAGICSAPHEFTKEYSNSIAISDQTRHGWTPINSEGQVVPGWHCNVIVDGPLEAEFTYGLPQDGSIWDRTWATHVFGLTWVDADPATNFKAGYVSSWGVRYCDSSDLSTPTNVWA